MIDNDFQSASQRLREARLNEGWELELVSQQTKIPVEFLRHIEEGQWDRLPGAVYARAFVKTLAGLYGLDQELIMRLLRHELNLDRDVVATPSQVITDFSAQPSEPQMPNQKPVGMIVFMAAIAVVFGGVLYFTHTPSQPEPVAAKAIDTAVVDSMHSDTARKSAPVAAPAPAPAPVGAHLGLHDTGETVTLLCLREGMVHKLTFHGRDSLAIPKDTVLTLRNLSGRFLRLSGSNPHDSLDWKFFEAGSNGDSFWVRPITEGQWDHRYGAVVGKSRKKRRE
jgi:hypothetical protein